MGFNVAIDGPAGAGKSTIAKQVAKELGFVYVDTGAMYRAMALYFLRLGLKADQEKQLQEACRDIQISISYEQGVQQIFLNGENVSSLIRQEEVGNMASATSVYGFVREKLLSLQRQLAAEQDVIMDGRDIGTCVLPDAPLKIFLTAQVRTRALRRFKELEEKGVACDLEEICRDIEERDKRDRERPIAPLKQAEDAVFLDSSELTISQVVQQIQDLVAERRL